MVQKDTGYTSVTLQRTVTALEAYFKGDTITDLELASAIMVLQDITFVLGAVRDGRYKLAANDLRRVLGEMEHFQDARDKG